MRQPRRKRKNDIASGKLKSYYISVRYFSEYNQSYTYQCLLENIKANDFVIVPTPRGNTVAQVVEVKVPIPSFQCKTVIKKVELS